MSRESREKKDPSKRKNRTLSKNGLKAQLKASRSRHSSVNSVVMFWFSFWVRGSGLLCFGLLQGLICYYLEVWAGTALRTDNDQIPTRPRQTICYKLPKTTRNCQKNCWKGSIVLTTNKNELTKDQQQTNWDLNTTSCEQNSPNSELTVM